MDKMSLLEYALVVTLIAIVVAVILTLLGPDLNEAFGQFIEWLPSG